MSASTQIIGPSILNSLDLGMWTTRMNGIIGFNRHDSNLLSAISCVLNSCGISGTWKFWCFSLHEDTRPRSILCLHPWQMYHCPSNDFVSLVKCVIFLSLLFFTHCCDHKHSLSFSFLLNFTLMTLPRQWYLMSLTHRYKKCVFCWISFCTAFNVSSALMESLFDFYRAMLAQSAVMRQ